MIFLPWTDYQSVGVRRLLINPLYTHNLAPHNLAPVGF